MPGIQLDRDTTNDLIVSSCLLDLALGIGGSV